MQLAKKSLGQNFFINQSLAQKIVSIVLDGRPEMLFEIGPGKGSFTQLISDEVPYFVCVEKDDQLVQYLSAFYPNIKIINQDVLQLDVVELMREFGKYKPKICFGSLPYNISKKIIRKFIEEDLFDQYYFIIQKEVAEKYCMKPGYSNLLGLTSSIYADPKLILNISPGAFSPSPKVVSSFILFKPNIKVRDLAERNNLEELIKQAFSSPRKTLQNNLKEHYTQIDPVLKGKRAEQLNLMQFIELNRRIVKI